MPAMRNIGLIAIAIAWFVVLVLPRRRSVIAPKLAEARRFVSRRIVDEEARASSLAIEAWEGEGGTTRGASGADDINHANQGHANQGHANQGHANQGHANQGHANQGHANQGHANQVHANQVIESRPRW